MPRLQVYLPDDLHREVKRLSLPASEMLQDAVRAELRRRDLRAATDSYLAELREDVGQPSAKAVARAEALARRIKQRDEDRRAG